MYVHKNTNIQYTTGRYVHIQVQTHKKYIMYVHIQVQTHKKYIMSINTQSKMQNYDQNTQKCAIISLSMKE